MHSKQKRHLHNVGSIILAMEFWNLLSAHHFKGFSSRSVGPISLGRRQSRISLQGVNVAEERQGRLETRQTLQGISSVISFIQLAPPPIVTISWQPIQSWSNQRINSGGPEPSWLSHSPEVPPWTLHLGPNLEHVSLGMERDTVYLSLVCKH